MSRYHRAIFTKVEHWEILKVLTLKLNSLNWQYSEHCIENIKNRIIDLKRLLLDIKCLSLEVEQIFEYYLSDNGEPEKICYRINWINNLDIILVLTPDKKIVTIYLNTAKDNHETLNVSIYSKG